MNNIFPERLTQARELGGYSKTEVAEKLNVSVAAVTQWENRTKTPTVENIQAFSDSVGVPMQMLFTPMPSELLSRGPVTFRARERAKTNKMRRQACRFAEAVAEVHLWIEKWISFPQPVIPSFSGSNSPDECAAICRQEWGLSDRPILKLGELLESKGIRLCSTTFANEDVDAYSCIFAGKPLIFPGNTKNDRARSRWDCAHELGHLVMHQHYGDEEISKIHEDEANKFAGAFLLPETSFSKDVLDTSLDGFLRLKPKWGVSVQAMVRRARDLRLITEETYERHYRVIGASGWRRAQAEPLDDRVPAVTRSLGRKSIDLLMQANQISLWELPNEIPVPKRVLESVFEVDIGDQPDAAPKIVVIRNLFQQRKDSAIDC